MKWKNYAYYVPMVTAKTKCQAKNSPDTIIFSLVAIEQQADMVDTQSS